MKVMGIEYILLPVIILVTIAVIWQLIEMVSKSAYKQGQQDALTGNIKIRLVEFKDGERHWYYENELKDIQSYEAIRVEVNVRIERVP